MYPRLVVGCALFLLFIRWNLELWLDGWYFLVLSICIPQKLILHNPRNRKLQTVGGVAEECYAVTALVHSICCWNGQSNQVICFSQLLMLVIVSKVYFLLGQMVFAKHINSILIRISNACSFTFFPTVQLNDSPKFQPQNTA